MSWEPGIRYSPIRLIYVEHFRVSENQLELNRWRICLFIQILSTTLEMPVPGAPHSLISISRMQLPKLDQKVASAWNNYEPSMWSVNIGEPHPAYVMRWTDLRRSVPMPTPRYMQTVYSVVKAPTTVIIRTSSTNYNDDFLGNLKNASPLRPGLSRYKKAAQFILWAARGTG